MKKLVKIEIDRLQKNNPGVEKEDIEDLKNVFSDLYLDKKVYHVICIYPSNGSFVTLDIHWDELMYFVWYNRKYRKGRYIFISTDNIGLLGGYRYSEQQKRNAQLSYMKIESEQKIKLSEVVTTNLLEK